MRILWASISCLLGSCLVWGAGAESHLYLPFRLRLGPSAEQLDNVGVRIDWDGLQNPILRPIHHCLLKLSDESDLARPEIG